MEDRLEPFAPPGQAWTRLSPTLLLMRRLLLLAWVVPLILLAAGAAAFVVPWLALGPLIAGAVVAGSLWLWLARNWRAWGYAERDDDLLVCRGWLIRRLVVVPYGRMQLVDVTAGPVERGFGLATITLHTAAAATDARIPGLAPDEAARLRDRLAALGKARSAGL